MSRLVTYVANDNVLTLEGLQNAVTDAYINDATVTVTLYEADHSTEVTGETWPLTMDYVSGSDGNYRATLADTLSLSANDRYYADVSADGGTGLKGFWTTQLVAIRRIETQ